MKNSITDYWKFGPDPAKWTLTVDYDDKGDAVLNLPDDLIKSTGWEPGTTLEWVDNKDGTFSLTKRG